MGNYRWGNYKRLIAEYFPILSFAFWIFWTLTLVRNWMDCKILISECFLTFISRLTAQEGGRLNNREGRFFISFCEHLVFYSATWKVLLCYVELHRTFCEHRALYSATWKALQKRTSSAVRKRTLSALRKREERVSKAWACFVLFIFRISFCGWHEMVAD